MYRNELITSCLSHTNDLMARNDLNDNRRKALIFQRRQIQNERNVEEIVQTNTEKVLKKEFSFFFINFHFRHFTNVVEILIHLQKLDQHLHY
jgi:hypothetical protein